MKKSQANRGMEFEAMISAANERYRKAGEGIIVKVPTKFIPVRGKDGINGCFVSEKSVVDFIGMYRGTPVAIEAKHTSQGRIRWDAVKPHQADFLTDWESKGGKAMLLVSFGMKDFFCIPWQAWIGGTDAWEMNARNGRGWAFGFETMDGNWWKAPLSASVKPSDLLPCWKIEQGGKFILPYLPAERKGRSNGENRAD